MVSLLMSSLYNIGKKIPQYWLGYIIGGKIKSTTSSLIYIKNGKPGARVIIEKHVGSTRDGHHVSTFSKQTGNYRSRPKANFGFFKKWNNTSVWYFIGSPKQMGNYRSRPKANFGFFKKWNNTSAWYFIGTPPNRRG